MEVRETIARQWLDRMAAGYPAAAARDPFRNPVRHSFEHAAGILIDELFDGMDEARIAAALEDILKIRAVQDFAPARALAFIFDLKDVIGEHNPDLCRRIDSIALIAFDLYMKCREKTYEVRLNEAKRMWGRLPACGGLSARQGRPA